MPEPVIVVVLPAYNAAKTLEQTIRDIPDGSVSSLLLVDDASEDETIAIANRLGISTRVHPENRGYGANQKTCYQAALEMGADVVVMLHPDYQYDPTLIPVMTARLAEGACDVVLGSRMLDDGARKGGMPWWKRLGNRGLSTIQNLLLGRRLSEYHTGYRAFTRKALESSGFMNFSDGFVFDAQMLVSLIHRGVVIGEVPCPARYQPGASSVGLFASIRYGFGCLGTALRYRLNQLGLFPKGWLGSEDPYVEPVGVSALVAGALSVWFLASRFLAGVDSHYPVRLYDSTSYSSLGLNLVSLSGSAPRPWPVPLLYSMVATDVQRVLLQMLLGAASWLGLSLAVGLTIRKRAAANFGMLSVLTLGLTAQVTSWDGLIMPESLGISLSVAAIGLALAFVRSKTKGWALALGLVAGTLIIARPVTAPIVLLLASGMAFLTWRRSAGAVLAAVVPIVIAFGWLIFLLPRQSEAYWRFENEVRGAESAPYDSDAFASVLFGRLLTEPSMREWLTEHGAPPLGPDMAGPRFTDDKLLWGPFRGAYARDSDWQKWFQSQGGLVVLVRMALEEPGAHAKVLTNNLPLILSSAWGSPSYPEYWMAAPVPPASKVWFTANFDLAVLLVFGAFTGLYGQRRRRARPPLFAVGLAIAAASVAYIVLAWLLVGIELVRHSVPGPLGLRIGLLLAVLAGVDASSDRTLSDAR